MKKILFALMLLCPAMVANASTPTTPGVQEINKTCPKCKGKGKIRCPKCKGQREYYARKGCDEGYWCCERCGGCGLLDTSSAVMRMRNPLGSGKVKCPTCKGKGKV